MYDDGDVEELSLDDLELLLTLASKNTKMRRVSNIKHRRANNKQRTAKRKSSPATVSPTPTESIDGNPVPFTQHCIANGDSPCFVVDVESIATADTSLTHLA